MKSILISILVIILFINLNAQVTTDIVNTNGGNQTFIGVQGFAINSIGHFKDYWKAGAGAYVIHGTVYTNHWGLVFQTGFIRFKSNDQANYSGDAKFNMLPLMVGGRYYLNLDRFRAFLLAMNGLNIVNQNYTLDDKKTDKTSVHYNFQVGLGLGIILFSNLEIELQGKYNSHLLEPSVPYNITGMEYGLALNWHLSNN
jgi:hypothetical protein